MDLKFSFFIKQTFKIILQNVILPCVYVFWRFVYWRRPMRYIIFADSHHDAMPYSMDRMYRTLAKQGQDIIISICNYGKMSALRSFCHSVCFMRLYAQARCVFICDNFLPVCSCWKSKQTKVVQLWHSCGLLKKIGYDTTEDIPLGYIGHVYRNYDLVTVSAPSCEEPMRNAMRLRPGTVKALGISRTDNYFDLAWREQCETAFYEKYPALKGKKLILWAPTFRGNAGMPYQVGIEEIDHLEQALGEDFHIIRKFHPHVDMRYHLSNCDIPTEELFPVIDLLISDYSSVVCEFMIFQKPYVMFAPDLEEYEKRRGFYIPYDSLTPYIAVRENELFSLVQKALEDMSPSWVAEKREYFSGSCDGNTTERILAHLGLGQEVHTYV